MIRWKSVALLAAAWLAPLPVAAQPPAPTQAALTADPERIAEARHTIDFIFPAGTYRRMMGGNFSRMMGGISTTMLDMKVKDVVTMGGATPEEVAKMSDATMRDVMAVVDPAYEQRSKAMFDGIMAGMADVMNSFEPEIRDALVQAYADKFTTAQLRDLNGFFATPTGHLYAESAMTIAMDPRFMDKVMKLTPRIFEAMPKIAQDALAKTKDLPPRRSYAALSQADKDKLSSMLGLSPVETAKAVDTLEAQQKKRETGAK